MQNNLNIVCLDQGTLLPLDFQFNFPHQLTCHEQTMNEDIISRIAHADIIITNKVKLTADILQTNPNIKMIAIAATGYNHVDIEYCQKNNIIVSNIQAYGNDSVAEHAFMLMLALMRQLPAYQRDVSAGIWQNSPHFCHFGSPMHDVNGKTLAIFGKGGIGQAFAKRAEAFGMNVIFAEHKQAQQCREGYIPFQQAIETADVLSLHCPLNDETFNMIDEKELQAMKPGAVLINVGRGGLVNEFSLVAALKYGQLGGAGIDVLTEEPPKNGNPLLSTRLPHLIITPHMAWGSQEAMTRLFNILCQNINAFVAGKPECVVV